MQHFGPPYSKNTSSPRKNLKEDRRHGDEKFPFQIYTGYKDWEQVVRLHWHNEMELIWMPAPGGSVTIGEKRHKSKESTLYVVHPGELHAWDSRGQASEKTAAIVFHPGLLELVAGKVREQTVLPLIRGKLRFPTVIPDKIGWRHAVCAGIVNLIREGLEKKSGYELGIVARLFSFLYHVSASDAMTVANPELTRKIDRRIERVKKALEYVSANYAEKIKLEELARRSGLSTFHFAREFKAVTRQTPINYLNRFRVERAALLLKDPGRKILDISMDVGFGHLSYFNKIFRRFQGCTPSDYRSNFN